MVHWFLRGVSRACQTDTNQAASLVQCSPFRCFLVGACCAFVLRGALDGKLRRARSFAYSVVLASWGSWVYAVDLFTFCCVSCLHLSIFSLRRRVRVKSAPAWVRDSIVLNRKNSCSFSSLVDFCFCSLTLCSILFFLRWRLPSPRSPRFSPAARLLPDDMRGNIQCRFALLDLLCFLLSVGFRPAFFSSFRWVVYYGFWVASALCLLACGLCAVPSLILFARPFCVLSCSRQKRLRVSSCVFFRCDSWFRWCFYLVAVALALDLVGRGFGPVRFFILWWLLPCAFCLVVGGCRACRMFIVSRC